MKKGFTLVELLIVIAILGIVAVIAFPTITNIIRESRESAYKEQERLIIAAARNYMTNNSLELPKTTTEIKCKTVTELQNSGFLSNKTATSSETGILNPVYNRTKEYKDPSIFIETGRYFDGGVKVTYKCDVDDASLCKYTYVYVDSCS